MVWLLAVCVCCRCALHRSGRTPCLMEDDAVGVEVLRRLLAAPPSIPAAATTAGHVGPRRVPVEAAGQLPYARFVEDYMARNQPVLIQGACQGWRAMQDWVAPGGAPDVDQLCRLAGHRTVQATDTARRHAGNGPCTSMTFQEYADWWKQHKQHRDSQADPEAQCGATAAAGPGQRQSSGHVAPQPQRHLDGCCRHPEWLLALWRRHDQLLYLKDFHLVAEFPDYQAYRTPVYFREDWLNEFYDSRARLGAAEGASPGGGGVVTSDYRFVYLGPRGSWTPLHSDVLNSYSWSANVCGTKRWLLLPPEHTPLLKDVHGRAAPPDLDLSGLPDAESVAAQHPHLAAARQQALECVQGPGEVLFVPSGWHHVVVNLEDTLSINHNWVNAHNVHWPLALLSAQHAEATESLEDCRDGCTGPEFEQLVQRLLAANAGLDCAGLVRLLATTLAHRVAAGGRAADGAEGLRCAERQAEVPCLAQRLLEVQRACWTLQAVCLHTHDAALRNERWAQRQQQEQRQKQQRAAPGAALAGVQAGQACCCERLLRLVKGGASGGEVHGCAWPAAFEALQAMLEELLPAVQQQQQQQQLGTCCGCAAVEQLLSGATGAAEVVLAAARWCCCQWRLVVSEEPR